MSNFRSSFDPKEKDISLTFDLTPRETELIRQTSKERWTEQSVAAI